MVIVKKEIVNGKIVIPIGSKGFVKAYQWGDKGENYILDFPELISVVISKDDVTKIAESISSNALEPDKNENDPKPEHKRVKIIK